MKKIIFSIVFMFAILSSMFSLNVFAREMSDGTYEVNIALWHSEDDKESMAADSIGTKATIVVKNGKKTMYITSGEMSMMGIKASLQELRIADAKGNYTDAKVESRDSEGNPTGFYFTMPHTGEYITVKVNPHLAIMGNKDISARIKVDYLTLKLIKSSETSTEKKTETTVVQTTAEKEELVTEKVTETETVSEIVTIDLSEETVETTSPATTKETTVSAQSDQPKENKFPIIIIVAVIVIVIIAFAIVKAKRK